MGAGIGEKRGIENVGLDLSGSEKKQKSEEDLVRKEEMDEIDYVERQEIFEMNNDIEVDDYDLENEMYGYEIYKDQEAKAEYEMDHYVFDEDLNGYAEDLKRNTEKMYEIEKRLFLRSIKREREEASQEMTDDEAINREKEEASQEMTDDEVRMFETKGWCLDPKALFLMPVGQDWYYCLRLNDADYGSIAAVLNSYEGDLKYDEFYNALSGAIHKGMSFEQIEEVATVLSVEQFPMLDKLAVHSACLEHLQAFAREERMEERIRLLSRLWTEAVSKKRDFTEVMNELYADIGSYSQKIKNVITQFFHRDMCRLEIVFWFDEFCQYVATHNANQTSEDIGKTAKAFCWDCEISDDIFVDPEPITYSMYAKKKLHVASTLGKNTP